ncbi:uncharacterized protein LOC132618062 [Lycium barbarum]|uniref:uncharacterized protein LOC132618062 n=1 Tax=Lycium barbarum TaxID=112863 RepID=UPI00293F4118|nr:uncharacterized protein LOC132618062 [Lycium barbarum]
MRVSYETLGITLVFSPLPSHDGQKRKVFRPIQAFAVDASLFLGKTFNALPSLHLYSAKQGRRKSFNSNLDKRLHIEKVHSSTKMRYQPLLHKQLDIFHLIRSPQEH